MLTAKAHHVLSHRYQLLKGESSVGELKLSWFGEEAEAVVENRRIEMHREGKFSGAFILESGGKELARAVKPSLWSSRFEVSFGNVTCELQKPSLFKSKFELRRDGSVIGSVDRKSIWKTTAQANLPDEWPNALKVFILWLVIIIWQREAAAASG